MAKVRYPRNQLIRSTLRGIGRLGLPLLARLDLANLDRFPLEGPLIVVGNHTGIMEVVLMTVYARRPVEYLGSNDIPHPPLVNTFVRLYGMIAIRRGQASRAALEAGLSILRQDGVLGLFPQGGIWEPSIQRIQTGVAWLSYRARAPVLPIGFNYTQGALDALFSLKRPRLKMRVGELIPAVRIAEGVARKPQLQQAARRIMQAIWQLVPAEDQPARRLPKDELFQFEFTARDESGNMHPLPTELRLRDGAALSKFLHRPTLFNNLLNNLSLPIAPLRQLHLRPAVAEMRQAAQAILRYLEQENPYYFTYRYGQREGDAMEAGIRQLDEALKWADSHGWQVEAQAVRSYQDPVTGNTIVTAIPEESEH
jgi:1-acyl-sn-glycerol-3-phosphate acyltransferase